MIQANMCVIIINNLLWCCPHFVGEAQAPLLPRRRSEFIRKSARKARKESSTGRNVFFWYVFFHTYASFEPPYSAAVLDVT